MGRSQEAYDRFEKALEIPMLMLSLVFIPIAVVPVVVDLPAGVEQGLLAAEWGIWAAFVFEYAGLLYLAPDRWRMVKTHVLDLVIIVVPFLRPLRFARGARLLRLARLLAVVGRAAQGLKRINSGRGFSSFLAVVAGAIVLGGVLVNTFEHGHPDASIDSIGEGLWWAIVTATTVGYGDEIPVTPEGRAVAVVMMLVGIALLSVVTANIASYFVHTEEGRQLDELDERLARIEGLLQDLVESQHSRGGA